MQNGIEHDTGERLRQWAAGMYPSEAAVEVLLRFQHGRFASRENPWIADRDGGGVWLDVDQLTPENTGALSGGEQRILRLVASLLGGAPVNLYEDLPGLDRETLDLMLAAIAHTAGSHEHSHVVADHEAGIARNFGLHPSLHPWPVEEWV